MDGSGPRDSEVEAGVLRDLAAVVTEAAARIHAEHRRGIGRWATAASILTAAGSRAAARHRHLQAIALVAAAVGSLAAAGHHRRLATLVRSGGHDVGPARAPR